MVVEGLEAVEVEHRQAQAAAVAAGAGELALEVLVPDAPVREPGQRVGARRRLQLGDEVGAVDRDRGLGGEQAQQLLVALGEPGARRRSSPPSSTPTVRPSWITGTQAPDCGVGRARASGTRSRVRRARRRGRPARRAGTTVLSTERSPSETVMPRSAAPVAAVTSSSVAGAVGSHSTTDEAALISRTRARQREAGRVHVGLARELVRDLGEHLEVRGLLGGAALGLAALQELGDVPADALEQAHEAGLGLARRARDEHDDADRARPRRAAAARPSSRSRRRPPRAGGRAWRRRATSDLHSGTRDIQLWPGKPSPTS